jgi:hypothetical protein
MSLVPVDEQLVAEMYIHNEDVGFVQEGQAVKVKLATFPFQKYGMVEGAVTRVSALARAEKLPGSGEGTRNSMLIKGLLISVSLICSLAAVSSAAQGVSFSVTTRPDRMGDRAQFSRNAAWFTTKGSAQVLVYRSDPYQRIGLICCQTRTERTSEYFLKSATDADLVLQVARPRSGKGPVKLAVYSLAGKLVARTSFNPATPSPLLALDRSRKHLALTDGATIILYDSSLATVRLQKLAVAVARPVELLLSTGARGALLIGHDALVAMDFDTRKLTAVRACRAPGDQAYAAAPAEAIANSYIVLTESGEGCRVEGATGSRFQTDPRADLRGIYFTPDLLLVITAVSVEALNMMSLSTQAVFDLVPFYEGKFGRNADEKPFFVQHEFDAAASRLYLRGSVNTGTLFEISVERSR